MHVVHNWSWEPVTVTPPGPMVDLLDEASDTFAALDLGAWDVRVLGE